jgi:hypothetical protein
MSYLATYSSRAVLINYSGLELSAGKGEDTFMTMEYSSDRFSTTTGASGDTAVSLTPDQTGTITLTYQATSESAKLLTALHGLLRAAEAKGEPVLLAVPMGIVDPSGSTIIACSEAALMSIGTNTLGLGENTRDFVFHVANIYETAMPEDIADKMKQANAFLSPFATKPKS